MPEPKTNNEAGYTDMLGMDECRPQQTGGLSRWESASDLMSKV